MASPTDWARVIATTIVNHLREEEVATFRKFKVFALLESSGNIVMNQSGRGFDWNVRWKNANVTGNTGDTPRTFARTNLFKRPQLPWKGFVATDAIFRREMLENRGQQALVDVAGKMAERLQESLEQHLSYQPYKDGNANDNDFHGMESFLGYTAGTTIDESHATSAFASRSSGNTSDRFGYPDDTFADISTKLGTYGGGRINTVGTVDATTPKWPNHAVDPEADFWSPVIVNYNGTGLNKAASGSQNWAKNCTFALREGIHQTKRNDSVNSQVDMIALDRTLYIQFLNTYRDNERIVVSKENGLKALGFNDVVTIDGVEVTSEYAVPAGKGYGFSIGNMQLRCLESQLMVAEGPFFDEETQAYRYACSTLGNFYFKSPRNFFALAPVTAAA